MATLGLALWHLGLLGQASLGHHALAVGAVAGVILAMLARVSLGHTGRPLQAPRAMRWAFASLQLAALLRVLLVPWAPVSGLGLSSACWMLAFALFLRHYAALFWRPRLDGLPG